MDNRSGIFYNKICSKIEVSSEAIIIYFKNDLLINAARSVGKMAATIQEIFCC